MGRIHRKPTRARSTSAGALKAPERETVPWVRIPPSPPETDEAVEHHARRCRYGAAMSDVGVGGTAGPSYELRPRPAVPTLAAAAVGTMAGCLALIIWGRGGGGSAAFLVLGIGLLLFGLSLAASVL